VPFSSSCVAVVAVNYRCPRCFYARDGSALDLGALRSAQEHAGARPTSPCFSIKDDMMNAGGQWSDGEVVADGNLITSRKPDDLPAFCREIVRALAKTT
jgi:putative intracellular protease/amidase